MRKRTSAADSTGQIPTLRVVMLTMDTHLASATRRAAAKMRADMPGVSVEMHAASEWSAKPEALARAIQAIATGDIVIVTMLFLEDHFMPVLQALRERREHCDALVCAMSAAEVTKLTRMGGFSMDGAQKGALGFLKKLKPKKAENGRMTAGAEQMRMLRRIPKLLRFIPGTAQDVRAYFLTLQYWLAGSDENVGNLIRALIGRYAAGPRAPLRAMAKAGPPLEYPETGLYHPAVRGRITDRADAIPKPTGGTHRGTVGLLVLRSYVLAGNAAHYDGVIRALEERGLRVLPAFASGLDSRPAIEEFFVADGVPRIDALVSLTGFSLVGGPAYNDSKAAEDMLAALDLPYIAAHPVEFQSLEDWGQSDRGLLPVESTIMVAIPELDGATSPTVFGGRASASGTACTGCQRHCAFEAGDQGRDMHVCIERAQSLASRVARMVDLRRSERRARKIAIVLFNFPPNSGNIGTAAFLSVFESLHQTLKAMAAAGYSVEVPDDVDVLRERIVHGNAAQFGAVANVHHRVAVDDHVRRERWLDAIEAQWGAAPGKHQSDGRTIHVLGERFGNVFVGIQPAFGYEGDPMRLLFEKGFAPTHAFSAFYRYLREDFGAHAVLHFGTHGALEFMPGKQSGMSGDCWPDRLIGDLPNVYLYAANNPSEGTIAKRRAAATMVSYLSPPVATSGLYKGLTEIKESIEAWRAVEPGDDAERAVRAGVIHALAVSADLVSPAEVWGPDADARIASLSAQVLEIEYTLIPHGLHVVGRPMSATERSETLAALAEGTPESAPDRAAIDAIVAGDSPAVALQRNRTRDDAALSTLTEFARINAMLAQDSELAGILKALDGGFVRPTPGGDLLRTPEILPTGRNIHGFDPFRIPSSAAVRDGARQAARLLARHAADGQAFPESVAVVLWGTDNLKTEGAPLAQALALMGALPRFDGYGRLAGATLIPLEELGRARVDVVISLSGIFRDLLPLQIKLLAEAAYLCAAADEPLERNFIRKHALQYQAEHGCDLETAALRVFGNADGAYGANVNHLVENGRWDDEDELAETYSRRKSFAFGRAGKPLPQAALMHSILANVDLTFQNIDSVDLGVTTVDTYFDTLGGISRAVTRARGGVAAPVYVGDETQGNGTIRTLSEQVALETRTRVLNPKWYEGMLEHGYEGVRHIEATITNTMGWSATTGEVAPWVYEQITETFMLDPQMRDRLAKLNPTAAAKVASRLLEAHDRKYWQPDDQMLDALRRAGEELEDRLEGVFEGIAA